MSPDFIAVKGYVLQEYPRIYVSSIPGTWLLERTTPSWRIEDPERGFQRVVREERARAIALAVLDQRRTFPNAIVLATDAKQFFAAPNGIQIPVDVRFLVVDGQHRLWAQKFSSFTADYACVIHTGLSEVGMAKLFLEINDNQKRVPSSLRWDLVRLVRPEDDPYGIAAVEMVRLFAIEEESPLYQRIDLTGEQGEISLKQGSLAPSIKSLLSGRTPLRDLSFDEQYDVITQYFVAMREADRDGWRRQDSAFYKARVIRAMLRLLPEIISDSGEEPTEISYRQFLEYLERINKDSLDTQEIRAAQGSAGIKAIYEHIKHQVLN